MAINSTFSIFGVRDPAHTARNQIDPSRLQPANRAVGRPLPIIGSGPFNPGRIFGNVGSGLFGGPVVRRPVGGPIRSRLGPPTPAPQRQSFSEGNFFRGSSAAGIAERI